GDGSAWTERSIDDNFDRPFSVYASDMDADGDIDVLGAAANANDVTWWENTAGDGTAWAPHTIDGDFAGARSVLAADLDGDGDADVVGAARDADHIAWWTNRGGQFAMPTSDVAPERVADGDTVAVLEIDAAHRGRAGDPDFELVTLELLLEDGAETPLDSTQANALVESLSVYLDDGSGVFEIGSDSVVSTVDTLSLTDGVLTVPFTDGDPDIAVPFGVTRPYFVVVAFDAASSAAVPDELRVTHLTESSSTAEDADHAIPLALEYGADTLSSLIEVNDLPVGVRDRVEGLEDTPIVGNVLDGSSGGLDSDEEGDALSAVLINGPFQGSLVGGLAANGSFTYQPNPDATGEDAFVYAANDGTGNSSPTPVTIMVLRVNDAPSFTLSPMANADQDLSPQSFPGFASDISAGPADEAAQSLTFEITNNS
ncbi:MAG: FG-GAP-like repeat-containing protein, partial [Acidobacteriota bacterium]